MNPITIHHNFYPDKFMWLWAKYATEFNPKYHCTNSIKGKYSSRFNKTKNPNLANESMISFDEVDNFKALYICGVIKKGYSQKKNYPHNVHIAIKPMPGHVDKYMFENWVVSIENGKLLAIPDEMSLPKKHRHLPKEYTTCRIFRWAACFFENDIEIIN